LTTSTTEAVVVDPVTLVSPTCRLFIDTNVFMDTDPRRQGGLKALFERIAPVLLQGRNPVIVPSKVIAELTKQSGLDPTALEADRAEAIRKAGNALIFLGSAEAQGLVRNDLGDESNPYADDLFVSLFQAYSTRYAMTLLTNDITLLLRINLLGAASGKPVAAGRLLNDGTVEYDAPQALYERGLAKLRTLRRRVEAGEGGSKDVPEIESLEEALRQYQSAYNTLDPVPRKHLASSRARTSRGPSTGADPRAFPAEPEFRGLDQLLGVTEIPGAGDEVLVESPSGTSRMILADKLGEGGEGSVYAVSDSQVVKIFDADHVTQHREEKIKLLASRGFTEPGICFPQAVVRNLSGEFVGYVMPKARGKEFSKAIFSPRRFRKEFPNWTKADLVDVAISFLEKVAYLHSLNIILGDINPKNLLVDADKDVWIIDADSWQLDGYPCPVGTEMFGAPSVIGRRYPEFLRTIEDERFAVATMLFMVLITGQFPYARSGSDGDIVRLIKEGNFAFQYEGNSNQDQPAGNWKYMWSHVQKGLKGLFWNTFHSQGSRYSNRPTDDEWLDAFREYRRYLASAANYDPMSNDVYPTRFKAMSAETPIYACAECKTSMAGIWNDESKTYVTPKLCMSCRSNLPKCIDCGRHKQSRSLTEGRCYDCNRKVNFAQCVLCAREKPKKSLVEGRCYDCNQGTCSGCGRGVPKHYLANGLCDRCIPVACKDCGARFKKSDLSYGRCAPCHQLDIERQAQRRRAQAERKVRDQTLDPTRLCTRCGKPFITYGNIAWHERNHRSIPTTHKAGYGGSYPTDCVPLAVSAQSRTPSKASTASTSKNGCFVATAVYGSYDCPEVWVLRRWRDSSLMETKRGRAFVRAYYATSPRVVAAVGHRTWFVTPARRSINILVRRLRRTGFSDAPYMDES
jgi:serine/threonine protein kinase